MTKGGVYGGFVMCKFENGTRKKFQKALPPSKGDSDQAGSNEVTKALETQSKGGSPYSPMVFVKQPIAQFFGFVEVNAEEMQKAKTRTYKRKYNGMEMEVTSLVSMGATGASRSVTVKFKKLENIGGKQVASVKVAMPASYTFRDMVKMLLGSKKSGSKIAAIVSPAGKSLVMHTPYNPKNSNNKRALPSGR